MEDKENKKFLLQYTITVQVPIEAEDDEDAIGSSYDIDPLDYTDSVKNTDVQLERAVELTEAEWSWWNKYS